MSATAWYAGFAYTFGRASYDPSAEPTVTIEAVAENLGTSNINLHTQATLTVRDVHVAGGLVGDALVPGGQKTRVTFGFDVDQLDGGLAGAVLTLGDDDVVRTVVPLGSKTGLVTNQPRSILGPTHLVQRDLTLDLQVCEVRADIVPQREQAPKGHRVLACLLDVRYDGSSFPQYFDDDQFRLRLPDGTAVGPTHYPIENLGFGRPKVDLFVAFLVPEPAVGSYVLQIVDVQLDETINTPGVIKDVPLTL